MIYKSTFFFSSDQDRPTGWTMSFYGETPATETVPSMATSELLARSLFGACGNQTALDGIRIMWTLSDRRRIIHIKKISETASRGPAQIWDTDYANTSLVFALYSHDEDSVTYHLRGIPEGAITSGGKASIFPALVPAVASIANVLTNPNSVWRMKVRQKHLPWSRVVSVSHSGSVWAPGHTLLQGDIVEFRGDLGPHLRRLYRVASTFPTAFQLADFHGLPGVLDYVPSKLLRCQPVRHDFKPIAEWKFSKAGDRNTGRPFQLFFWRPDFPGGMPGINPCGSGMDWLRSGYRSGMRWWPGQSEIQGTWIRCKPGAGEVSVPHALGSFRWDSELSYQPPVGEIYPVANWNGWQATEHEKGEHWHGPPDLWLIERQPSPEESPVGYPAICEPPPPPPPPPPPTTPPPTTFQCPVCPLPVPPWVQINLNGQLPFHGSGAPTPINPWWLLTGIYTLPWKSGGVTSGGVDACAWEMTTPVPIPGAILPFQVRWSLGVTGQASAFPGTRVYILQAQATITPPRFPPAPSSVNFGKQWVLPPSGGNFFVAEEWLEIPYTITFNWPDAQTVRFIKVRFTFYP